MLFSSKDLYEKIVVRREGGWCYQLNGGFHWLLTQLGFDVSMHGSTSPTDAGEWRHHLDHMIISTRLPDGKVYHTDVGFGMYRLNYNPLEVGADGCPPTEMPNGRYKIDKVEGEPGWWSFNYQKLDSDEWVFMYKFTFDKKYELDEFQEIHEIYAARKDHRLLMLTDGALAHVRVRETLYVIVHVY